MNGPDRAKAVAAAYARHQGRYQAIANDLGVAVRTAERWVYEARRWGVIPPAAGRGAKEWSRHCPTCGATQSAWKREVSP